MQASMPQAGYDDNDLLEDSDEDEDLDISDEQDSAGEDSDDDEEDGRIDDAGKIQLETKIPLRVLTHGFTQNSKMTMRTSYQSTKMTTISSIWTICQTFPSVLATLERTTLTMMKRSSPVSATMLPRSASVTQNLPMARRRRSERSFPCWRARKIMQRSSTMPRRRTSRFRPSGYGGSSEGFLYRWLGCDAIHITLDR
jgi:hypothetical protein